MYSSVAGGCHEGGRVEPRSAHAACRAAPRATYSAGSGTSTGTPNISGAISRSACDRAPPPISRTRRATTPCSVSCARPSANAHSSPSTAARARCAGVALASRRPCSAPVALGRLGVRSPSKYGTRTSPALPGGADSASRDNSSWSTRNIAAAASSTRAPLSRHGYHCVPPPSA